MVRVLFVHGQESGPQGMKARLLAEHFEAPLLRFLLSTGARRSEALGLEWRDVELDRGRIRSGVRSRRGSR